MKKKGQFYLIAAIIIAAIFIGLVTIQNSMNSKKTSSLSYLEEELNIEKSKTLDYIAAQNLNDADSEIITTNFSKEYTKKIGNNNEIIFITGTSSLLKLIGNHPENTVMSYDSGEGIENITQSGEFEISIIPSDTQLFIYLDNGEYSFSINTGQNIYYLVKHEYNGEVEIIYD